MEKLSTLYLILALYTVMTSADLRALLIGGGEAGKIPSVELWPPVNTSKCVEVEDLPQNLYGHSAVSIGNEVYVCGEGKQCYVTDTYSEGDWRPSSSMNEARELFSLLLMGEKIVAIGGYDNVYRDSVEIYEGGEWIMQDFTMTEVRFAHCSVEINDEEVIILGGGGQTERGRLTSMEKLNIVTGEATRLPDMPSGLYYHACAYSREENFIYTTGGFGSSVLAQYLDLNTGEWHRLGNLNTGRDTHRMAIVGGKLTVFGGSGGRDVGYLDSVEQYDPATDSWSEVGPMYAARYAFALAMVDC